MYTGITAFQSYMYMYHTSIESKLKDYRCIKWHIKTYHFISAEIDEAWKNYEVTKISKQKTVNSVLKCFDVAEIIIKVKNDIFIVWI